jgi:hypothetical protein
MNTHSLKICFPHPPPPGRCVHVQLAGTKEKCQYASFRIPGLTAVGNRTLIAAAEGRKMGCGDFGPPPPPGRTGWGQHDLVIRRSTDSGHSWGQLTTLLDAIDFRPWKNISATSKPDNGNAIWLAEIFTDTTPGLDQTYGCGGR